MNDCRPEADRATVDPIERATPAAALSNAIGELEQADTGSNVMSTAQNGLASRLQVMLVERTMETGQISTVRPGREVQAGAQTVTLPELLEVRFDGGDWLGWLGMAHFLLFKPDRSPWVTLTMRVGRRRSPTTCFTCALKRLSAPTNCRRLPGASPLSGLQKLRSGTPPSPAAFAALEYMIRAMRPAPLVLKGFVEQIIDPDFLAATCRL